MNSNAIATLNNNADALIIGRLQNDSVYRQKALNKIYGANINITYKLKNKFEEDLSAEREKLENDYNAYRILRDIDKASYTRPSEQRQVEIEITEKMSEQNIKDSILQIQNYGSAEEIIIVTQDKNTSSAKLNFAIMQARSLGLAVTFDVAKDNISSLKNLVGLTGVRVSNVKNEKDIDDINKALGNVDSKTFDTVVPNKYYFLDKEIDAKEADSLIKSMVEKNQTAVVPASLFDKLSIKIDDQDKNNVVVKFDKNDKIAEINKILKDGYKTTVVFMKRNLNFFRNGIEQEYKEGSRIGSNGFENFDSDFAKINKALYDDELLSGLTVENISEQLSFLSKKGQFAIQYILEQKTEEQTEMVKALLEGMYITAIEENLDLKGISNNDNLKDVLDILSPKDRQLLRKALLNIAKDEDVNNIKDINNAIADEIEKINKKYGEMNAADAQKAIKEAYMSATNMSDAQIAADILRLFDFVLSERNAGTLVDKLDPAIEGVRDILTAA